MTERNNRMRQARKAAGMVRQEVWLSPERQADLKTIQQDTGLSAQAAISGAIWSAAQEIRRR